MCRPFGSYLGAWRAYFKRLVEFLKNHQKPCKVLQKSRFGGLNIEPRSPKIALRSSLGVTFVEQDRPRASKSVPRVSQAAKKSRRSASEGYLGQSMDLPWSGPAECAVPAEGGGGKPPCWEYMQGSCIDLETSLGCGGFKRYAHSAVPDWMLGRLERKKD